MRAFISMVLAIAALYLTIWPHELGHSTTAYLYGCKANWWQTGMSPFLWNSRGGDIDYTCLQAKGNMALIATDGAGIVVNLFFLAIAPLLGRWRYNISETRKGTRQWVFLGTFWWALANYAEAFSYLILNTLWLKSDMETVVHASGTSQWLWFAPSVLLALLIGLALRGSARRAATIVANSESPGPATRLLFPLYVVVVSAAMAAARIILT